MECRKCEHGNDSAEKQLGRNGSHPCWVMYTSWASHEENGGHKETEVYAIEQGLKGVAVSVLLEISRMDRVVPLQLHHLKDKLGSGRRSPYPCADRQSGPCEAGDKSTAGQSVGEHKWSRREKRNE